MSWLRKNRYRGLFASLMIAVFFGSQAFSCCLVNHRLGQFVTATFTRHSAASEHSCCQPRHSAGEDGNRHSCQDPNGCCIQDANQKLPQLISEQAPLPDLTGLVLAVIPLSAQALPSFPTPPSLQSRSSPPTYLTQLRLLI